MRLSLISLTRYMALGVGLLFSAACGNSDSGSSASNDPDAQTLETLDGLSLFADNGCGACHCNNGQGGCNLEAPNVQSAPLELLRDNLVRVGTTPAEAMKYAHPIKIDATDAELNQLAMFLGRLDKSAPQVQGGSQVTQGFQLYIQAGCVVCHLTSAQGTNQGGIGVPIAGTDPENVYRVLTSPETSTHPVRAMSATACDTCTPITNDIVERLTDVAPPDEDIERSFLSYFLTFIAPIPRAEVEPCLNRPGEVCTIAGTGIGGFSKDNVTATSTPVYYPLEVNGTDWNADGVMDLAIDDWNNHRARVVNLDTVTLADPSDAASGVVNMMTSIAGTGKVTGDDALNHPTDVTFDANGALVMANWHNQAVYRYARGLVNGGMREQVAGICDLACAPDSGGPSQVVNTLLALPSSIAIHPDGRIFTAEAGCSRIRIIDATQATAVRQQPFQCTTPVNLLEAATITTMAGGVMTAAGATAECGQGGPCVAMNGYEGDGGPASAARFRVDNGPVVVNFGISLSRENPPQYLYIADSNNNVIRRINLLATPEPTIELVAGDPSMTGAGFADGPGITAKFKRPSNVYVGPTGTIFVADTGNHRVRAIDPATLMVSTVLGTGTAGFNGDNQPAEVTQLNQPNGMWQHPDGRLFVADTLNNRIRVVCPLNGCPTLPEVPVAMQ